MSDLREPIQSVRGMHDLCPQDSAAFVGLCQGFAHLARRFGYQYAKTPILEKASLFERSVGAESDIAMGEMYRFQDKGGEDLCLRPEGTAPMVRMAMQHRLVHNQTQRLYYDGPMFRRERPQKGRYRQFHQLGVELLGETSYWAEVELIQLVELWLKQLSLENVHLHINTLGARAELLEYQKALFGWFEPHQSLLGQKDQTRLHSNPIRLLDSKDPKLAPVIADAPLAQSYLSPPSRTRFESFCSALTDLGIAFKLQPRLVRGLEYYSHTVFEWVDESSAQAQNTIVAGGRYDDLALTIGARAPIPACGFAAGVERLLAISSNSLDGPPRLALVLARDSLQAQGQKLACRLRGEYDVSVVCDISTRNLATKIKEYAHQKVDILLVVGDKEQQSDSILVSTPSGRYGAPTQRILLELCALDSWLSQVLSRSH